MHVTIDFDAVACKGGGNRSSNAEKKNELQLNCHAMK